MNKFTRVLYTIKRMTFFLKSQYWTREQIELYQDEKLKEIVKHAGIHVPYYRELFKNIGLDINSFKGREDLQKIPLLDKETLRTRNNEFVADNASRYGMIWEKTSGSTGTPLNFLSDYFCVANKWAMVSRSYKWAGYKWGMKLFYLVGFKKEKKNDYYYNIFNNALYLRSIKLSDNNALITANIINKFKPQIYIGYPRSLLRFAQILKQHNVEIRKPKSIYCYGESLTINLRNELEILYGTSVYDFYGNTECSVAIGESRNHQKLMMEDFFYPEIIDQDGNVNNTGKGELVGTSFYNYAMPLIRYKTRDIVSLSKSQDSIHSFIAVDEIIGRKDDYVIGTDGRFMFMGDGAIAQAKGIVAAQYIQEELGSLIINLIVDDSFKFEFTNNIKESLVNRLGNRMIYEFRIVEKLEINQSGKTPFIINRIKGVKKY